VVQYGLTIFENGPETLKILAHPSASRAGGDATNSFMD
jgi:hypothetical protein